MLSTKLESVEATVSDDVPDESLSVGLTGT
jgi:hypothetical protein